MISYEPASLIHQSHFCHSFARQVAEKELFAFLHWVNNNAHLSYMVVVKIITITPIKGWCNVMGRLLDWAWGNPNSNPHPPHFASL